MQNYLQDFKDIKYIPIVVFTTEATLKVNTKSKVIYTTILLDTIKNYNEKVISVNDVNKIYNLLLKSNIKDKEQRRKHVEDIRDNVSNYNDKVRNNICPKCNGKLVLRKGKYGEFYGCSNFPKCRFIKKI